MLMAFLQLSKTVFGGPPVFPSYKTDCGCEHRLYTADIDTFMGKHAKERRAAAQSKNANAGAEATGKQAAKKN